jgi:hypothetical protein
MTWPWMHLRLVVLGQEEFILISLVAGSTMSLASRLSNIDCYGKLPRQVGCELLPMRRGGQRHWESGRRGGSG